MPVPFWIVNLSQARLNALEARWSSALTQVQLANPWQQIRIDGKALPGLWSLKDVERKITAQANKKSGADGGSATIRGLINPELEADGELYIPSQFAAWLDLVPTLDVVGNPANRAQHLIEHPLCTLTGVRAVLILKFKYTLPEHGGPLRIKLGMLGVDARDGATKQPKAPPVPTALAAPTVPIPSGTTAAIAPSLITPPGPGR